MKERQRQDYLEAMGIQPWYPRFVLPGALPSGVRAEEPEDTAELAHDSAINPAAEHSAASRGSETTETLPSTDAPVYQSAPYQAFSYDASPGPAGVQGAAEPGQPKSSAGILDQLLPAAETSAAGDTDDTTTGNSSVNLADNLADDGTVAEPFRLAVIEVSDSCLAVTDLPWSGQNQFTSQHERLLGNILKAVGIKADQELRTGLFAWPMYAGQPAAAEGYAEEAINGFLVNQFGLKRRNTLLLFGRTSCRYLWSREDEFEQCRGVQSKDGSQYAITCSLGEMLSLPNLKAEAWANLRPLCSAPAKENP